MSNSEEEILEESELIWNDEKTVVEELDDLECINDKFEWYTYYLEIFATILRFTGISRTV